MPSKLKDLVITKVALVDEGACSEAHIQLYKRKVTATQEPEAANPNKNNKGGVVKMTYEQILASLTPEQKKVIEEKVSNLKTAETTAMDEMEKAKKDAKKAEAEVAKLKKPIEGEKSEEEVLKSLDPAVRQLVEKSRKQAQAAEEAIKKMKADQEEKDAINKAKEFTSLGAEEELVSVVKCINKMETKVQKSLYGILEKAHKAMEETVLDEIGRSTEDNSGNAGEAQAWNKIEKKAMEIAKAKTISQAQAITEIIQNEPKLYNDYLNSQA